MHSRVARMQNPFTWTEAYDVHLVYSPQNNHLFCALSPSLQKNMTGIKSKKIIWSYTMFLRIYIYWIRRIANHKTPFNMIRIPSCISFTNLQPWIFRAKWKAAIKVKSRTFLPLLELCQYVGWTYPGCCCHRCLLFSSCFSGHWSSSLVSVMNRKPAQLRFKMDSITLIPLTTLTYWPCAFKI